MNLRFLSILLTGCLLAVTLPAQVTITGFTQTGSLPVGDDNYSTAIDLGFSIDFGGTTFSQTYVSNNGYITFGGGSGTYYPSSLTAGYAGLPIIAAFFSDVDTRPAPGSDSLSTGTVTWGTGLVDGLAAFAVKWDQVGEYPIASHPNSSNTFEIVLVSRTDIATGNFDFYLNYGPMNWDHGDSNGLGAVAGFHNGSINSPLFYEVPGSGTSGAFVDGGPNSLFASTNSNANGVLTFTARDGAFGDIAPITVVPEPSTVALFALGLAVVGYSVFRRSRRS
jgi:hypothetical protein